jgi:hypothetical protein
MFIIDFPQILQITFLSLLGLETILLFVLFYFTIDLNDRSVIFDLPLRYIAPVNINF